MNGEDITPPAQPAPAEAPAEALPAAETPVAESPVAEAALAAPPCDDVRARLVRQFDRWVDRMLEGEDPPAGLPPEIIAEARSTVIGPPEGDLYALYWGLTKLSGDVRLQARAFKDVAEAISPLGEVPARMDRLEDATTSSIEALERVQKAFEQEGSDSGLPGARAALDVLFDLYDRMERSLRTLDAQAETLRASAPAGLLARLTGAAARAERAIAAIEATREGQKLTLSRLAAALHEWNIERIGEPGDAFDPGTMTAVDVETRPDQPEGTVLEVYRSGYATHDQVLATAQVKVSRAGARTPAADGELDHG